MKVLCISDSEEYELYEGWTDEEAERLKDVGLILSAGDLGREYLEFLVTMLNVPLLYVRGNHDSCYDEEPPEGCVDIDDKVAEIVVDDDGTGEICENIVQEIPGTRTSIMKKEALRSGSRLIRIAGLGGSIRDDEWDGEMYPPEDEYTEDEMASRVKKLRLKLTDLSIKDKVLSGLFFSRRNDKSSRDISNDIRDDSDYQGDPSASVSTGQDNTASQDSAERYGPVDILLTHSPAYGHGDLTDPAHSGFRCFNEILMEIRPAYHIYGHVHMEYGRLDRESVHPSGTREINVSGMYILEV